MNYNHLFDLTPINYQEQLICSDYLEDREKENIAHCLRNDYINIIEISYKIDVVYSDEINIYDVASVVGNGSGCGDGSGYGDGNSSGRFNEGVGSGPVCGFSSWRIGFGRGFGKSDPMNFHKFHTI